MDNVIAQNMTITSSSADGFAQTRSSFDEGDVTRSTFDNGAVTNSDLINFNMELDKQFDPPIDENSWFALKNEKTGETEKITYKQFFNEISRTTQTDLKVYVDASKGDDANPGTMLQPVRTLERASELAIEKAGGDVNRNAINNAVHISVGPGTYYTKGNIALPDDCAMTSTAGQYATVIEALPGYENNNAVLVGSGNYVQGFAFQNWKIDNFDYPEGGFAVAYRPGAKLLRSPYIRDSSQLSNFLREDVEPPLQPFNTKGNVLDLGREFILEAGYTGQFLMDDEITFSSGAKGYISWDDTQDADASLPGDLATYRKIRVRNLKNNKGFAVGDTVRSESGGVGVVESIGIDDFPNPLVGRGGGCMLADRRVLDPDSLYTYVLCFGFTPRSQNGIGYVARDGAGVNGIGSLSIFVRVAFYALNGGQMTLNNSGTQFGDISMRAKGSTEIFAPKDIVAAGVDPRTVLIGNTVFADAITTNEDLIIEDMVTYLTANTANGGLGYTGYDAAKCERDSKIIIDGVGYDITLNTNYWNRLAGITYRSPISSKVIGEQLDATLGANRYLQSRIEDLFDGDVITRANTSFQELYNVAEYGEENMNPIIFTDTGDAARTSSREIIQDNRDFIQDELIDWIENNEEFFAYDSIKCKRDVTEYILPAAKYDMLLDTNYNAVRAGGAYYMKSAEKVVGQQRNETVAAYRRLKEQTNEIIDANSFIGTTRVDGAFDEIIDILDNRGTTYTPTNATYDPTTGLSVITIGTHTLEVGRKVLLAEGGLTFSCGTDGNVITISHPRVTDPAYNSPLEILAATSTSITVNVGKSFYTGAHTFVSALDNSVIELGSAITFSDDVAIPADQRNARKQLQANRTFIQDLVMGYIDDNYFRYDSDKCTRDMLQYILPAVERDIITGTNFNALQTGIAYRQGTQGSETVVRDQLVETVGAIEHLKDLVANSTLSDSASVHRAEEAFDQIIDIINNEGKTYTPTNASYDPVTGVMEVTIGSHDLREGQTIILADESMTFECGAPAVQITHPRPTDPAYRTPLTINSVTATTVTVNVGDANGYTGAHVFVSAEANAVKAGTYISSYTPSTATYDPVTGVFVATIGQHNLVPGDYIEIKPESITFECGSPAVQISHPRVGDPAYRTPVKITAVTTDTITCNVGNAGGYTGAHTFVSAEVGAIDGDPIVWTDPARYLSYYTPTTATYDPATGISVVTIPDHDIAIGDFIEFAPYSFTFTCSSDGNATEHSYPRKGDGNYNTPMEVTNVAGNDITVNVGVGAGGAHTFVSASSNAVAKTTYNSQGQFAREQLQANRTFLQEEIMAYLDTQYFVFDGAKCSRDTGLILDAIRRDVLTGSNFNSVFAGLAYRSGNASTEVVVNDQLTETVGAINYLKTEIGNRLTGTAKTRADAGFDEIIDIMNNGQGNADAITFTSTAVGQSELEARQNLQANKAFLKAEITAWIAENYPSLTYNVAKCERDVGYLVDSVSFDIQHGGNSAAINNARLYYDNAVAILPEDQRIPTARAFQHISSVAEKLVRGETVTPTTGNAVSPNTTYPSSYTPTDAAYDPVTGIMTVTFGSAHGMNAGDYIYIATESMTFECGSPAVQISHPRTTDFAHENALMITEATATTITVYVGNANGYTGAHTFVSADAGAITRADFVTAQKVSGLFEIVSTMVQENNFDSLPEVEEPTTTIHATDFVEAFNLIDGVTEPLQSSVISFIREEYNGLPYNKEKCYRDVGLITDAVSKDIEYGGNANTLEAARYYFGIDNEITASYEQLRSINVLPIPVTGQFSVLDDVATVSGLREATNILPIEQRQATKDAFLRLATVAQQIVTEATVTKSPGNGETQDTSGTAANAGTGTAVSDLFSIIANVVDDNDLDNLTTTEVKPLADPNRTVARKQIQKNRNFIIEEIIAYLNDEYFTFDGAKCKRDVGLIVDAVKRDVLTGSNFNAVFNGLAYRSGTAGTNLVIDEQLTETISAVEYTRDSIVAAITDTNAKARATAAFNEIIDIMGNGSGNADTITFGTESADGANGINAREQLQNNKAFLQAEMTAYIADNYPSLTYNVAKCERDVGYLVDSVSFDAQHGGNTAVRNNAQLYFENAVSVLPADQRAETADAFAHLAACAELIVRDIDITTAGLKSASNGASQNFAAAAANAAKGAEVEALMNVVSNAIAQNSLESMPALVEPTASAYGIEYQTATLEMVIAKPTVQDGVLAHLSIYFNTLSYNEDKCRRDTGYIIDAVSHDIQYGGNAATVNAAHIYFQNAVSVLPLNQRQATRDAFLHLAEVMNHVTREIVVTPTVGNSETQNFSEVAANPLTGMMVQALVEIVANTVDDATPATANIPPRVDPVTEWVASNYTTSADLIEENSVDLASQVVTYITETYNGLSFPEGKCRRDIGYLIDAVSHDVQYGGNYATRIAAGIYFENGISVLPADTRQQTADVYAYLGTVVEGVVQEIDVSNADYTSTAQDTSGTPATLVEGQRAATLIGYVEDVIRADNVEAMPVLEEPDTSWVAADLLGAAQQIDDNKLELANDMVEFLRREFDVLDYNKAKCRRDVGYLLDAFSFDLNYGGNTASRWNADFYFWNNAYRIPEDQRIPTAKSYRQLGRICKDIVLGTYPGQVVKSGTGGLTESNKVESLANIFYLTQINNDTKYLPAKEEPDYSWVDAEFRDVGSVLELNKIDLAFDTVRYVNATYKYIDINLTRRDGYNLLKAIAQDFKTLNPAGPPATFDYQQNGDRQRTRAYTAALFDYNGKHVFPVFNSTTPGLKFMGSVDGVAGLGGITGQKPNHAYIAATDYSTNFYEGNIYYWNGSTWVLDGPNNTELLDAFVGAWERMRNYLVNNLSPNAEHTTMINGLINNCLIDNVLRPETLTFGSLVESIAHQFNGASAGVNRNALPLNFRNLGLPISALASVLSEDGGRVRWSGADELNNQYFARGLRINGRTGRIEGRPFTSSVRKLARRASNSRAVV